MALALGRTVEEIDVGMSSREFAEWQLYYQKEPWGEERADLRVAQLTALTANINRAKGQKPFQAIDFMPFSEKPPVSDPVNSDAALLAFLKSRAK